VYGTSVATVVMTGIVNAAHSFEPSSNAELSKIYSTRMGSPTSRQEAVATMRASLSRQDGISARA
jgi:hypothetical protein